MMKKIVTLIHVIDLSQVILFWTNVLPTLTLFDHLPSVEYTNVYFTGKILREINYLVTSTQKNVAFTKFMSLIIV